jgi:hypothetical protein
MVLVEVKTQNSPFYGSSKLFEHLAHDGGEYQNFARTLAKTAPKSFFYTDKIEILF